MWLGIWTNLDKNYQTWICKTYGWLVFHKSTVVKGLKLLIKVNDYNVSKTVIWPYLCHFIIFHCSYHWFEVSLILVSKLCIQNFVHVYDMLISWYSCFLRDLQQPQIYILLIKICITWNCLLVQLSDNIPFHSFPPDSWSIEMAIQRDYSHCRKLAVEKMFCNAIDCWCIYLCMGLYKTWQYFVREINSWHHIYFVLTKESTIDINLKIKNEHF